jgi:hypothetical protein
MNGARYPGDS